MGSDDRSRVDVVCLGSDGREEVVASAFLAGECVLITGEDGAIRTICHEVCERCGLDQRDGAAFLDGMLDTYHPSGAVAYGAWCAVIQRR